MLYFFFSSFRRRNIKIQKEQAKINKIIVYCIEIRNHKNIYGKNKYSCYLYIM